MTTELPPANGFSLTPRSVTPGDLNHRPANVLAAPRSMPLGGLDLTNSHTSFDNHVCPAVGELATVDSHLSKRYPAPERCRRPDHPKRLYGRRCPTELCRFGFQLPRQPQRRLIPKNGALSGTRQPTSPIATVLLIPNRGALSGTRPPEATTRSTAKLLTPPALTSPPTIAHSVPIAAALGVKYDHRVQP